MQYKKIAYAPVASDNGQLWVDECEGPTKRMLHIYDTAEAAEANKVEPTDLVKEIILTWEV